MSITYAKGKATSSARLKVLAAAVIGILAGAVAAKFFKPELAPLSGWDVAAAVWMAWEWLVVRSMDGAETQAHAVREDPSRGIANTLVLVASVASLVTVAIVLASAANAPGSAQIIEVALGVISVVVSWTTVHMLFLLRYAELYYRETPGGVDFPGTKMPTYHDFAYLSFTIGMTYQVSDTGFETTEFRRTALHQALIAYLFGTVIVATTINLIAGLSK